MFPGLGAPSLAEAVARAAADRRHGIILLDPGQQGTSYEDFARLIVGAAGVLASRGVAAGDRVVTICQNQLAFFAVAFGAWQLGAVLVPLNPNQRGTLLARLLRQSEPTLVLVDASGEAALRSIPADNALTCPVLPIEKALREGSPRGLRDSWDSESSALILFSSGTTGVSKGCVLSHQYMVWCGEEFCRAGDLTADDAIYSPGPLFHINAWWAFAAAVVAGVRHAFDVRFSGSRFWSQAAAAQATLFDYAGAMISLLLKRSEERARNCRLRAALGGAARPAEMVSFAARFGFPLLECYGLTECCLPIFQREHELKVGSIGRLSEHFGARLVDETGAPASDGAAGELWLKPKSRRVIFDGYWQRPDLTDEAYSDGWFRTGDICRRDRDGYFTYLDRKRHFIRRRGENVSPFEVEGIIFDHPAVANCALIGVEAELGEEDVLLAVQPKEGMSIEPAELLTWCDARMARYMVPRYVRVMTLPLTPSERVEKQKLRDEGVPAGTFDAERSDSARREPPEPSLGS
jgi:crotonobetaine/carnitine-CoA ligase